MPFGLFLMLLRPRDVRTISANIPAEYGNTAVKTPHEILDLYTKKKLIIHLIPSTTNN